MRQTSIKGGENMNRLLYVLSAVVITVILVSYQNSTLEVNDTEINQIEQEELIEIFFCFHLRDVERHDFKKTTSYI